MSEELEGWKIGTTQFKVYDDDETSSEKSGYSSAEEIIRKKAKQKNKKNIKTILYEEELLPE